MSETSHSKRKNPNHFVVRVLVRLQFTVPHQRLLLHHEGLLFLAPSSPGLLGGCSGGVSNTADDAAEATRHHHRRRRPRDLRRRGTTTTEALRDLAKSAAPPDPCHHHGCDRYASQDILLYGDCVRTTPVAPACRQAEADESGQWTWMMCMLRVVSATSQNVAFLTRNTTTTPLTHFRHPCELPGNTGGALPWCGPQMRGRFGPSGAPPPAPPPQRPPLPPAPQPTLASPRLCRRLPIGVQGNVSEISMFWC